jgi:ABC-type sulfate transport system substrate-binding protein
MSTEVVKINGVNIMKSAIESYTYTPEGKMIIVTISGRVYEKVVSEVVFNVLDGLMCSEI